MRHCRHALVAALVVAALLVPGKATVAEAAGEEPITIRFASLATPNSAFGKVLRAWGAQVEKETEGRVKLTIYTGGSQGDERDFIRKIRAGQIDAAGATTTGLGIIVPAIYALTVPGVVTEYEQLERVWQGLGERLRGLYEAKGFHLLAWGTGGKNRLFSAKPFMAPNDLKRARPWVWKGDPVFDAYIGVIGANPVRIGAHEVYGALETRMIDTLAISTIGAVAYQWYTRLNYVAKDNLNIITGGSIIKKEKMAQLRPSDQKILFQTAERAADAMDEILVKDDEESYRVLVERGLQEVDNVPSRGAWERVAKKTRKSLAGRVFSKELMKTVESLAAAD
ncbi:MAG: TRAP transporter substrate-binding protein DctP [Polyangiales bacterium]